MRKVLEGIRVLDFSRYAAGPVGTLVLADMGAEVIRVEKPGGEDDRTMPPFAPDKDETSLLFMNCSRSKKCITLNLWKDESQEIIDKFVKKSDIVVHNFAPGTKHWKRLQYEHLKEVNPGIIVLAVSGFGQTGPYTERPGFDSVAQAMSGSVSITGFPDGPPIKAQAPWVDILSASYCSLGAMFALYHRTITGEGQLVDVSLLDSAVFAFGCRGLLTDYSLNNIIHHQIGNKGWYLIPGNLYKAKDGWMIIAAALDPIWERLTKAMGQPELSDDQRFSTLLKRFENRDLIDSVIETWVKDKTTDELVAILEKDHVPCGPVYNVEQTVNDPHIRYRETLVDINYSGGKALVAGMPIKMMGSPGKVQGLVSRVGEYNEEIYGNLLNLSPEELAALKEKSVI